MRWMSVPKLAWLILVLAGTGLGCSRAPLTLPGDMKAPLDGSPPSEARRDGSRPADRPAVPDAARADQARKDQMHPAPDLPGPDLPLGKPPFVDIAWSQQIDQKIGLPGQGTSILSKGTLTQEFSGKYGYHTTCSVSLSSAQVATLLAAANPVSWATLQADYRPSNSCGGLYFENTLTLTLKDAKAGVLTATTTWCQNGQYGTHVNLPQDFGNFAAIKTTLEATACASSP